MTGVEPGDAPLTSSLSDSSRVPGQIQPRTPDHAGGGGEPPLPAVTPLNEHFWRGGATGRLLIQRCGACGYWLHPPTPACRRCRSTDLKPEPVSGRGRVRTFTVNHQPWFAALAPLYVIAIVELEEQPGLQFLTRLVDCDPDTFEAGLPVTVRFERHGDVHLPLFAPAPDGGEQR